VRGWIFLATSIAVILGMLVSAQTCALGQQGGLQRTPSPPPSSSASGAI
jgi:hypothetical protein